MKITKELKYKNNIGLECSVLLFEDENVAITGAENYIIENSEDALKTADEILRKLGYLLNAEK